jgi:hypothetical protein
MTFVVAVLVAVLCLGSLAIGFARSIHRERQRRLQVKSKWSDTPQGGHGDGRH